MFNHFDICVFSQEGGTSDPLLGFFLIVGGGLGFLAGGACLAQLQLALAQVPILALFPVLLKDRPAPPLYQLLRTVRTAGYIVSDDAIRAILAQQAWSQQLSFLHQTP